MDVSVPSLAEQQQHQHVGAVSSSSALYDTIGTISVLQFGARRLPELQTLYQNSCAAATTDITNNNNSHNNNKSTIAIKALQSSGRKKSQRHLRRRATSYKRFKQNRYYYKNDTNNSKHHHQLHHHKDRDVYDEGNDSNFHNGTCRRQRRQNRYTLCHSHESWRWTSFNMNNNQSSHELHGKNDELQLDSTVKSAVDNNHNEKDIGPSSRTNWMTTHLYYVKRCSMMKVSWPSLLLQNDAMKSSLKNTMNNMITTWSIPIQHINRGASAALRLVQVDQKCTIQDTTWNMYQPIWFQLQQPQQLQTQQSQQSSDNANIENLSSVQKGFQKMIQRMIPNFLLSDILYNNTSFSNNRSVYIVGDETNVIYEPDQFPNGAIGPMIVGIFTRRYPIFVSNISSTPTNAKNDNESYSDYVYIFVHASIRSKVYSHLKLIFDEQKRIQQQSPLNSDQIEGPYCDSVVNGGMSCIQIRGSNNACKRCFEESFVDITDNDAVQMLPNDTITDIEKSSVRQQQQRPTQDSLQSIHEFIKRTQDAETFSHNEISMFQITLSWLAWDRHHQNQQHQSKSHTTNKLFSIYMRRVCPRDVILSCNYGVCGYDILCPSEYCKMMFQNFIYYGNACIVGIVEDAYICLECIPPLLVFPRDYPDTIEGRKYWTDTCVEWKMIRHYWEGGGGRISKITTKQVSEEVYTADVAIDQKLQNIPSDRPFKNNKKNHTVDWFKNVDSAIVVVRTNDFLHPFHMALYQSTNYAIMNNSRSTVTQRNHRSKNGLTHPVLVVEAPLLSKEERQQHQTTCQLLLNNLSPSMFAILMCSIQLNGKGTLQSGCRVYPSLLSDNKIDVALTKNDTDATTTIPTKTENIFLGYVTTGLFSVSRGHCYGIAMIDAQSYLHTLVTCLSTNRSTRVEKKYSKVMIATCPITKRKSIQLLVYIENRNDERVQYEGTISLIHYS